MREFIFPRGTFWTIADAEEIGTAELEGGGLALLLFSDEDLAATYISDGGFAWKPVANDAGAVFAGLLRRLREAGATHVVIDHSPGRAACTAAIEKVIADVERQAG